MTIKTKKEIEPYLERIFMGLRNISHISSMYNKFLQKNLDVTTSQLLFLRTLNKEDNLSAGEIGRRIFIKPGTITGLVDRLENKGLVARVRASRDRRVVNVAITDVGREMIKDAPVPIQSRLAENLNKLSLEEVETLTAGLERLINLMQYDEASTEITRAASESEVF